MMPPVGPPRMPRRPQCSWLGFLIGWKARAGTPVGRGRPRSPLGKGLLSAGEGSGGYIRPAFWSPRVQILYSSRLCRPLRPERDTWEGQRGKERRTSRAENKLQNFRGYVKDLHKYKKKTISLLGRQWVTCQIYDRKWSDCLTSNSKSVSCSVHSLPALAPLVWDRCHKNNFRIILIITF